MRRTAAAACCFSLGFILLNGFTSTLNDVLVQSFMTDPISSHSDRRTAVTIYCFNWGFPLLDGFPPHFTKCTSKGRQEGDSLIAWTVTGGMTKFFVTVSISSHIDAANSSYGGLPQLGFLLPNGFTSTCDEVRCLKLQAERLAHRLGRY